MTQSRRFRCDLLLLAPLAAELAPLRRALGLRRRARGEWRGDWHGRAIVAAVTGPGPTRAGAAAAAWLEARPPRALLLAGFAGGLAPGLVGGDVVRPSRVVAEAGEGLVIARGDGSVLVTASGLFATPTQKAAARRRTGADAVDMEAAAVGALARQRAIPFGILRAVLDDAHTPLAPESTRWLRPDGRVALRRAAASAVRAPHRLSALLRLARAARRAGRALGAATGRALARGDWPFAPPEADRAAGPSAKDRERTADG